MESRTERWAALDAFRGFVFFLMLPVNAAMDFRGIPAWFKHAPSDGATMPDFIMPAFLIALDHAMLRYFALFAFGTVGFFLVWHQKSWEILQMLGMTGALAFPLLFLPPAWRLASAIGEILAPMPRRRRAGLAAFLDARRIWIKL
jgi:predicted acyltransferase